MIADWAPSDRPRDIAPPPDIDQRCEMPPVVTSCIGDWCIIPAGCNLMGSPWDELCRVHWLESQHKVRLTRSFVMSRFETTRGDFEAVLGYPSWPCSCYPDTKTVYPALVTWHEAVSCCNALSKNHGLSQCYECTGSQRDVMCSQAAPYSGSKLYNCPGFRLPTEAEWEYAYRAGTTSAYYDGTDPQDCGCCPPNLLAIAHYASSSVAPVGSKLPNGFGLHDMAGNVEEWAADWLLADLGGKLVVDPFRDQPGEQEVDPLSGVGRPLRAVRNARYVARSSGAIRAAVRWGLRPEKYVAGFRCVRTLNP